MGERTHPRDYDALMKLAKERFDALMAAEKEERASCRRNAVDRPGRKRGRPKLNRRATCHPDREHVAKGLCQRCYQAQRPKVVRKPSQRKARQAA